MRQRLPRRRARVAARYACACVLLIAASAPGCDGDDRDAFTGLSASPAANATVTPTPPDIGRAAALSYEGEFEAAIDAYAAVVDAATGDERQQSRFAQARLLLRTERYGEATLVLDAYLAAAGVTGDASVARFMHASALRSLGDPAGALGDPARALAGYERHIAVGGVLAGYARAEQALVLAESGRIDEARAASDALMMSALRLGYIAGFALRIGDAFASAGADADAFAWYARAQGDGRDTAAALARVGALKRKTGDPSWAADYLLVIARFPERSVALSLIDELDAAGVPVGEYLRGVVEYRAGRDGAARETLARAAAAGDNAAESTYYMAAIDERAGSLNAAIDGYARAVALDPASPLADNALWWRGRLLEGKRRYDEASAVFGELVGGYPHSEWAGDARFHRGMALFRAGEHEAAASAWALIGETSPDDQRAKMLFWRGRAEMAAGLPGAQATLETLIAEAPGDFYALRAEVLLGRNDTSPPAATLSAPPADWDAIARYIEAQFGFDPRIEATPAADDPRWAVGAALEDAGMHAESVAVYQSIREDNAGEDLALQYRITRRFDEEGRTSAAARAATTLWNRLDRASATAAPPVDVLRIAYPLAYGDLVAEAADGEDLSPLLLLALVRQESFYDPQAGSSAGALGLTQVIEPTGRAIADALGVSAFSVRDLYRPGLSLRFGASYIADQLTAFDGNAYHALAAYNGGPGTALNAIDTAGGDIDLFVEDLEFDETRLYVKLVMENYARYRQLYEGLDRPSLPD